MRSWTYVEPMHTDGPEVVPHRVTMTENEILEHYYPYWAQQMMKHGFTTGIYPLAAIEDWIIVHWAEPARPESEKE